MVTRDVRFFIDEYKKDHSVFADALKYGCGMVKVRGDRGERRYTIAYEQFGAHDMFSIGQPVYDGDGNLLGFLGIGVYSALDYCADIKIPVERWEIFNQTHHCVDGARIYTYWQNEKRKKEASQNESSDL